MKKHILMMILVFALSACSFPTGSTTTPTDVPPIPTADSGGGSIRPTDLPTPTDEPTAPASGAVNTLQDVKKAIIQIEATGTFVDPEFGLVLNSSGRGSGFIIDSSGLAVTNNHVVTGAALIRVWVGGESEPRNARLVAASECSDLALIDIEGDGFPYLEWFPGVVDVGLDVYAAGFPLGDPEFTLTRGVVSKARADGNTNWASVASVIEHDANINPGNSGGPLVNPSGQVVAVNYAGARTFGQFFAIAQATALPVIEQMKGGRDVLSIGVNGQAIANPETGLYGIWVSSVKSGSQADKAGIRGGDIIFSLEGLVLSTDYTMKDYCDILRSHNPSDTLTMEVIRFQTGEFLEGQLNGRVLEVTGYFNVAGDGGGDGGSSSGEEEVNQPESGDVLYYTDFTDDADNEYWYSFTIPDYANNYRVEWTSRSNLYVQVDEVETTAYVFYDYFFEYADVVIDAAVETVAGPNRNNISILCRGSIDGWYEFSMNSGGLWYIWLYDGEYTMLANGGSNAINLQKAANIISASCIGDQLTFYVNYVEVGSVRDRTFRDAGQAGLSVSTFDIAGAGAEFSEFMVSLP